MDKLIIISFAALVALFTVSCGNDGATNVIDTDLLPEVDVPVIDVDEEEEDEVFVDPAPVVEDPVEESKEEPKNDPVTPAAFVQCLADAGVVVYASRTCPACAMFAESLGGYEVVAPIFVECSEERERCSAEMQTNYVPEIQINGVLYEGSRAPEELARITGCEL